MTDARVLLTVGGRIVPELATEIAAGRRPRADYMELAVALGADLLDFERAGRELGWPLRLFGRLLGPRATLVLACFKRRNRHAVIVTDGEGIGLPLAVMLSWLSGKSTVRHVMITHVISTGVKKVFLEWLGARERVDRFVVYSSLQRDILLEQHKIPVHRVVLTPFMVDARFFRPRSAPGAAGQVATICSVGQERRDYPTLMKSVQGLPVRVVVAAASPWSRQPDGSRAAPVPANVEIGAFHPEELREVYARSRFLVMPLHDVPFQAGVTAILEAMAMEKPVICSRARGQTDVLIDGETGIYVPPGDPAALRQAIEHLLSEPEEVARMGRAARRWVEEHASIELYIERFRSIVAGLSSRPQGRAA
jgi:glycosyltransferase involved in cell wall biosynthesis